MMAVQKNQYNATLTLLEYDADPWMFNCFDQSSFMLAVIYRIDDIFNLLLDNTAQKKMKTKGCNDIGTKQEQKGEQKRKQKRNQKRKQKRNQKREQKQKQK